MADLAAKTNQWDRAEFSPGNRADVLHGAAALMTHSRASAGGLGLQRQPPRPPAASFGEFGGTIGQVGHYGLTFGG